ncbi:hypothetical protein ACFQ15_05625 [Sphingomonas hankookensis]|uniref:hypothetical protein n=1 Tax=Sphingomonas hankookensis TaxID=563996 RepID=UPI001F578FC1|nr:hypothetical protein [Sphingomonas hankookensis]
MVFATFTTAVEAERVNADTAASARVLTGKALADIVAERVAQVDVHGYDLDHDRQHDVAVFATAAIGYAATATDALDDRHHPANEPPPEWPWEQAAWKPGPPRAMLVKAAALLWAAIDRHDAGVADAIADGERPDYDISDAGVMTALPTWQRNNRSTFLRLQLVAVGPLDEATVAGWTDEQVQQADIWAWTTHLSAGDHDDIVVPAKPAHVPDFTSFPADRNPITGEKIA